MAKVTSTPRAFSPDYTSAPGETVAELLRERDLSQADLADRLGVTPKHINQVINGNASLSAELALGLEKVFGVSADFWLTRESLFRADLARHQEEIDFEGAINWARKFPVAELKNRDLLPQGAKGTELVAGVLRFFGIASPKQWKNPAAAFRKSQIFESDPYALSAWLRIGQLEAMKVECAPYDADRFREVLEQARSLTCLTPDEWEPQLKALCADAGVAFVVVGALPKVRANGAARWLSSNKALLQLSVRYKWEDIFWFSFFHEAAHLLLHRKKHIFVEPKSKAAVERLDPDLRKLEHEADSYAANVLIPPPYARRLSALRLSEVPAFAQQIGIAKAIVVGRMQHDDLMASNVGNHLRRRFELTERS